MANYKVKCEVVQIMANKFKCSTLGQTFVLGARTPEGMCARAYAAIYPASLAMRFSEDISWEQGRGYIDIMCPDNDVIYRLSRIKDICGFLLNNAAARRETMTLLFMIATCP